MHNYDLVASQHWLSLVHTCKSGFCFGLDHLSLLNFYCQLTAQEEDVVEVQLPQRGTSMDNLV
jgi:hypothetical protein